MAIQWQQPIFRRFVLDIFNMYRHIGYNVCIIDLIILMYNANSWVGQIKRGYITFIHLAIRRIKTILTIYGNNGVIT